MEPAATTLESAQSYVERHFVRNSLCMISLDLFWGLANPFVNWMLLQPVLLEGLKGSALIEELPALSYALIFGIFSIFAAYGFHGTRHRTLAAMALYFIYGLFWLTAGVLFLTTNWPRWAYIVTVVVTGLVSNIFNCLGHNQDMYLMIDSIPVRRRGFTWAMRQAGLVIGIFTGALAVGHILSGVPSSGADRDLQALAGAYVVPYGWCFVVGGITYCVASLVLLPFKEAPAVDHWTGHSLWRFIADESRYLWSRLNFRWLLASNCLSAVVAFGLPPIVTIHAKNILGAHESVVARFISVVIAFQMVGGVAGGLLGDRFGYKLIGAGALVMLLGTIGVCYWADDIGDSWLIYTAFAGLGILAGAGPLARAQFVKEVFPENDISTVLAIEYMLMTPFCVLGPLGFGLLVDAFPTVQTVSWSDGRLGLATVYCGGLTSVWVISAMLTLTSLAVLVWKVREPRHQPSFFRRKGAVDEAV